MWEFHQAYANFKFTVCVQKGQNMYMWTRQFNFQSKSFKRSMSKSVHKQTVGNTVSNHKKVEYIYIYKRR